VINATALRKQVEQHGFAICEGVLSSEDVERLLADLERMDSSGSLKKQSAVFAVRNLLDVSAEVRELASSGVVRELVEPVLGPDYLPARGILFDKIPEANWKVPWHQDVTIAVQNRVEAEGFGAWSMKADVLHVQPPSEILEQMISVRIHLDPCGESNGALRVIPGSHGLGRIPEEDIPMMRSKVSERICAVGIGGALLMRPLLLHASAPSLTPGHRRVIHIDFAAVKLPNGMRWLSQQ
jgi:ectoine hydroxylase-related dioxygenase (phytanoyl-CoA dioxygenase family)